MIVIVASLCTITEVFSKEKQLLNILKKEVLAFKTQFL